MKTISLNELQSFIMNPKIKKQFEDEYKIDLDHTFDDEIDLNYYASETENWGMINNSIFSVNPQEGTITYKGNTSPEILIKKIKAFTEWVFRSYDNDLYDWESDAWDDGVCQSDDDVDYNGSYLEIIYSIFEFYLNYKNN